MRWPWVSRGRYDDLKESHRREVEILAAWVEQLQAAQSATVVQPLKVSDSKLSEKPEVAMYISSEEEDLIDAHAQGLIDDEQFQQGMAELGRTTATIG